MRVGLIGDTHDHVIRIRESVSILNRAGVGVVVHVGDYCSPFAVRELQGLDAPLHGITGNNDGDVYQIQRAFAEIGARLETQWWETRLGERRALVMHEPRGIVDVAAGGEYDLIVYGHTHERDERRIGETLVVNPGEACGWLGGIGSLAIYDTDDHEVTFHEF
ncbi:MAG TPA: YfcE family phosphodiesterase [Gemmatimonadota bacterium]|nr:YfcE family phosphodiesterase [Gemmatimonadota bacterium]